MSVAVATEAAAGAVARQFVTFWIQGEVFGLPLGEVQEIIRMPNLVRVPMAADTLEGIANLRGAVLPITSLRRILGMDDVPHDDATRVVVGHRGGLSGFVVDRMASVITTGPGDIEPIEAIAGTIRTDLLAGIVRHDEATIMLLDPPSLAGPMLKPVNEGMRAAPGSGMGAGCGAAHSDQPARGKTADVGQELQLVSFEVEDQEYAFPIEDVQEIVQVPARIRPMPRNEAHVLGVMTLRSRLLPLVSLRRMFDMAQAPVGEHNRIVVVTLRQEAGVVEPMSVGIVTDTVNEVLRVSRSTVEPVPPLLLAGETSAQMQAICRLAGDRLVTILSAEKMFADSTRARLSEICAPDAAREPAHPAEEASMAAQIMQADLVDAHDRRGTAPGEPDEEQFVVFRLGPEEFGVPISAVQEIVRVPDHLTRVPRSPAFIEGVINLRGVVLPVVEQRRRFGLVELPRSDRQRIIVLTVGAVRTGFIVDCVVEVLKVARSTIGPTPIGSAATLAAAQQALIDRVANLEGQKRMLLLIQPARLLSIEEQGAVAEL